MSAAASVSVTKGDGATLVAFALVDTVKILSLVMGALRQVVVSATPRAPVVRDGAEQPRQESLLLSSEKLGFLCGESRVR